MNGLGDSVLQRSLRELRKTGRGFTLMELLLALGVTVLIATCIAIMVNSVSSGTQGQQDGKRYLVRLQALQSRLTNTVHSIQCVLAVGTNNFVYSIADSNANDAVDLAELGMIQLDTASGELRQYQTVFPSNFSVAQIQSANTEYAASTVWASAAQTATTTYLQYTVIAKHVTAFSVSLDSAEPTSGRLVTMTLTLSDGQTSRTGMIAAAVRNPVAPQ